MKKYSIVFLLFFITSIFAGALSWRYVTIAAAGSTTLATPNSGAKIAIRSILISTLNATNMYFYEGTAASMTKKFPSLYLPAYGTIVLGTDTNPLEWIGTKDTAMKIWSSAAPGTSLHKIGVKYENITN